jgi:hypothetical protein
MPRDPSLICKSEARARYGLTAAEIRRIGPPDAQVPNWAYRKAAPVCLYAIARIETWLSQNAQLHARSRIRSEAAKARAAERAAVREAAESQVARTAVDRMLASIRTTDKICCRKLWTKTQNHFESSDISLGALLAYARHTLTNYDRVLDLGMSEVPGIHREWVCEQIRQSCSQRLLALIDPLVLLTFGAMSSRRRYHQRLQART